MNKAINNLSEIWDGMPEWLSGVFLLVGILLVPVLMFIVAGTIIGGMFWITATVISYILLNLNIFIWIIYAIAFILFIACLK